MNLTLTVQNILHIKRRYERAEYNIYNCDEILQIDTVTIHLKNENKYITISKNI